MTPDEERLRQFGAMIGRLIRKEDLSRAEAKECWRQICMREQPDLQQGAFMSALAAKPETLDEIAGTFDALYEYDTTKVAIDTPEPIMLYVMERTPGLADGVAMARAAIRDGRAMADRAGNVLDFLIA